MKKEKGKIYARCDPRAREKERVSLSLSRRRRPSLALSRTLLLLIRFVLDVCDNFRECHPAGRARLRRRFAEDEFEYRLQGKVAQMRVVTRGHSYDAFGAHLYVYTYVHVYIRTPVRRRNQSLFLLCAVLQNDE